MNGQLYNSALLRRYVLIPQQTGRLTIDPAELVCLVNVRTSSRSGNSIFDSFFDDGYTTVRKRINSKAVTVNVRDLPAGAPADFGGGVGQYRISARLSRNDLKAHEAGSLIVTISGRGNLSLLEAPELRTSRSTMSSPPPMPTRVPEAFPEAGSSNIRSSREVTEISPSGL